MDSRLIRIAGDSVRHIIVGRVWMEVESLPFGAGVDVRLYEIDFGSRNLLWSRNYDYGDPGIAACYRMANTIARQLSRFPRGGSRPNLEQEGA